jgi:hypothetical protein
MDASCDEIYAQRHVLMHLIWKSQQLIIFVDMTSKIEALRVKPKLAREIIAINKHGEEQRYNHISDPTLDILHVLWKATLNNGEEFALDLTGAQLGWYNPVVPWHAYLKNQMQSNGLLEIDPVDIYYAGRGPRELSHGADPYKTAFNEKHSNKILPRLVSALHLENWTLQELFEMPEKEFKENQRILIERCKS